MFNKIKIITIGLIGMTMLLLVFLAFPVSADDVVDQITINVPVSCTLSGTNLTHNASMTGGQYKTDIGSANIKAVCNDTNGLAVYAIGYSNDTFGNDKMISSTVDHTYDIPTGRHSSGDTNSSWSMKLTPVSGTYAPTIRSDANYDFTDFEIIPSTYTKVAYRTSATDSGTSAIGANFTTTYGIYVSTTQPADSYTGKVKFTLVHPQDEEPLQPVACTAGKICYQPNANDVTGQMGNQSASNNASVTLYAPNFKRTGYGFAGWNTEFDYSGTTYGPNETITAPSDVSTNGLSLYAVWIESAGSLQNWSGCSSLAEGAVTALTDERDSDTYAVAKLADGKCWMIENLRLADKDSNNNDINLSSSNTHNPLLPLNNSWYYKNQQGALATSNHLSVASDPTSTNPDTAWCTTNSSDCTEQSMLATNNTTLSINNKASSYSVSSDVYSYGNYYNWYSATAGNGKYSSGSGYPVSANGDICPAGWHLPIGGDSTGEFVVLDIDLGGTGTDQYSAVASKRWRAFPNNIIYSGIVNGSSISARNTGGTYWTASMSGVNWAEYFSIGGSGVNPIAGNSQHFGRAVRCVISS